MKLVAATACLALGTLAACQSALTVDSATTDAVTITYLEGSRARADEEASKQCAAFGKRAKFRNVHAQSGRYWAIYDCAV